MMGQGDCFVFNECKKREKYYLSITCRKMVRDYIGGDFLVEYTANETPMTSYLNTHLALQQMRENAKKSNNQGPRVK